MSWETPTTYLQRFGDALELLCAGKRPTDEIMSAWLEAGSDDIQLQEFACEHGPSWTQGIGVIDAAITLADQPTEILTIDGPQIDHERRAELAAPVAEPVEWQCRAKNTDGSMSKWKVGIDADKDIYVRLGYEFRDLYTSPPPASASAIPTGWKLVPVEPTQKMQYAGHAVLNHLDHCELAYKEMLKAAPLPPAPTTETK